MSFTVKWTEIAINDLENYIEWIRKDSEYQAGRVANSIFDLVSNIERSPLTGHIVPEIKNDKLRFKIIYGRRFIYEIRGDIIVVKRIISCKMDFMKEFNKYE